mmetsp:Transcript_28744/g.72751  ORF Transcript_28744/g.72751 Transcript_28744/m.72751 type:complete len:265 (-) Transcript_28744:1294-2088(-)
MSTSGLVSRMANSNGERSTVALLSAMAAMTGARYIASTPALTASQSLLISIDALQSVMAARTGDKSMSGLFCWMAASTGAKSMSCFCSLMADRIGATSSSGPLSLRRATSLSVFIESMVALTPVTSLSTEERSLRSPPSGPISARVSWMALSTGVKSGSPAGRDLRSNFTSSPEKHARRSCSDASTGARSSAERVPTPPPRGSPLRVSSMASLTAIRIASKTGEKSTSVFKSRMASSTGERSTLLSRTAAKTLLTSTSVPPMCT